MKIAFDIGGVISKWPDEFRKIGKMLYAADAQIHIITDMHDRPEVLKMLLDNGFGFIPEKRVHCADYKTHGELCKALIMKRLEIDVLIDDFPGYMQWDSSLGPAPIRLMVSPDGLRPYWHETWKTPGDQDFGRRVASVEAIKEAANAPNNP